MIKKIFYLFVLISTTKMDAQVVANLDWIKYYSDKSTINNVPSAIDVVSNVYSTGFVNLSPTVIAMKTLKYDSLGTTIFAVQYSAGTYDRGTAIKTDASGNVYCSGISYVSSSANRNYLLIKYSSAGTLLWSVTYNGSGSGIDEAYDLKLDNSGNIYVTGKSLNSSGNYDIVTLKYSNTGSLIWSHTYNNGFNDSGVALVLSSDGSKVFVTGTTVNSSSNTDIVTYELNASTGALLWSTVTAGIGNSNDYVNAITLSGANVVICGYLYNTSNDYVTIKYKGNSGVILWQKSYAYSSGTDDKATALVKDSTGNIAVTGTTKLAAGAYEYHTVLYDSTGIQLWVNKENTGLTTVDVDPKIATDTIANHFYVCGQIQTANSDVYVYQIAPSGNSKWKQIINGQDGGKDAATNLVVNGIGEVFLSAQCKNTAANYDITTIKIGQTPIYYPVDNLNEMPIEGCAFVENRGQLLDESGISVPAATVQYYTENTVPHFFFKDAQMSFIFAHYDTILATNDTLNKVNVNFIKSNGKAKMYANDQYVSNQAYFNSAFPDGVKNVKGSKYLFIPNIYPYIDLHYSSNVNGVKYYFVVKPGGNPALIEHQFVGASSTGTITGGSLMINTAIGSLRLEKAYVYQVVPTSMTTYSFNTMSWSGDWISSGTNQYKFNVGTYNPALALVFEVDQGNSTVVGVSTANNTWNTFVGGDKNDEFTDLKLDPNGNMYALQNTKSGVWYTVPFQIGTPLANVNGAQIYKFNKYGVRVNQTYFGSSGGGIVSSAIAVMSDSTVILTGRNAGTIPTITTPLGGYTNSTGSSFILKYATNIQTLQWSTRYPGSIMDVDVNGNNDIYVLASAVKTGVNTGEMLNKTNALNLTTGNINGSQACVVTRFTQACAINWSSFIPVYGQAGIKVDKKRNNYYVFGNLVDTTDFKHFNKYSTFYQPTKNSNKDAFIQKFTNNDTIKVSTLYGGNDDDTFAEVETMANGDAYLVGSSLSSDNSTISFNPGGAYVNTRGKATSRSRGLITRFDSIMERKWATTYGDSAANSSFYAITKDSTNNVYVGGQSYGMPTYNGLIGAYFQSTTTGNAALLRFDANNQRNWATYMGGTANMGGAKAIRYNRVNNNLCFSGAAGYDGVSYPFANFTSPQAYWQPFNYVQTNNFAETNDAFIGRFALVGVFVGVKDNQTNKFDKNGLSVYPNPTSESVILKIDNKVSKPYVINIVNILGQTVYTEMVNNNYEIPKTLNLSGFINGVYFVNVVSDEMNKITKLIKE